MDKIIKLVFFNLSIAATLQYGIWYNPPQKVCHITPRIQNHFMSPPFYSPAADLV